MRNGAFHFGTGLAAVAVLTAAGLLLLVAGEAASHARPTTDDGNDDADPRHRGGALAASVCGSVCVVLAGVVTVVIVPNV